MTTVDEFNAFAAQMRLDAQQREIATQLETTIAQEADARARAMIDHAAHDIAAHQQQTALGALNDVARHARETIGPGPWEAALNKIQRLTNTPDLTKFGVFLSGRNHPAEFVQYLAGNDARLAEFAAGDEARQHAVYAAWEQKISPHGHGAIGAQPFYRGYSYDDFKRDRGAAIPNTPAGEKMFDEFQRRYDEERGRPKTAGRHIEYSRVIQPHVAASADEMADAEADAWIAQRFGHRGRAA